MHEKVLLMFKNHANKIIILKRKKIKLLTNEQQESCEKVKEVMQKRKKFVNLETMAIMQVNTELLQIEYVIQT